MKLEIKINGAWRTVIANICRNVDADALYDAQQAASMLVTVDARCNSRPHTWRLVDEWSGTVVEICNWHSGWKPAAHNSK